MFGLILKGPKSLWGTIGSSIRFDLVMSIFIGIFWNFFWRFGNVLAFVGIQFFFPPNFWKKVMLTEVFFSSHPSSYKYTKKTFKKLLGSFPCRIDSYLHGKHWFIQCWFVRWTRWGVLFFGQSWHLIEKITYYLCFLTQFSQFSKIKKVDID
jgi:hypothetical protein